MTRMSGVAPIILIGAIWFAPAAAQDIGTQRAALKEIREAAADICYTVEQRGRKNDAQLTGEVQATLSGAVSKLVDLGVKGSGQYWLVGVSGAATGDRWNGACS